MRRYIGIVHQEENSAYGVHFPDVPGCVSAADTLDDLMDEAMTALALHLEDMPTPAPSDANILRADPEVQADLADGAFMMAIPLVALSGRTVRANVTFDSGLLDAIDATAKRLNLTRSAYLADVARRDIAS